jgi:hypothetical protein
MIIQFTLDYECLCRGRRGKFVDRSHLTTQVLAGPNCWHYQRMGLEGLAIEVITHWLGSEDLPLREKISGESFV